MTDSTVPLERHGPDPYQAPVAAAEREGEREVSGTHVQAIGDVAVSSAVEVNAMAGEAAPLPEMMPEAEYSQMLQENYGPFAGDVAAIKHALQTTPPKEVPGYFAAGNESNVFMVEREGGKRYALRISKQKDAEETAEHISSHVRGCRRGQGIPGMEQLVGVSYEDGVTVAELIDAKGVDKYSSEEIAAIPESHWRGLARTLVLAADPERGVSIDGSDGNLLYGAETGFAIVDYSANDDPISSRGIAQPITGALFANAYWLPHGKLPVSERPEDYAVLASVLEDTSPVYDRWIQILSEVEQEQGVSKGFLLRLDELTETGEQIKLARQALSEEGAVEALTAAAREKRLAAVEKLRAKAAQEDNDFIKDNVAQRADKLAQEPGPIFPKGKIKVSRNDKR